ncbi:MAG: alpha/beta hydrolase [Rhizobiales bacterium]|nr:alpha/beta hydrolase [Rhizobacter sp.]
MKLRPSRRLTTLALASLTLVTACGGSDDDPVVPEETRAQDSRNSFAPSAADAAAVTFTAQAAAAGDVVDMSTTSRWQGVLKGSLYKVEVPQNWNGKLVMYAHGFRGTGNVLTTDAPAIRRWLIQNGYAWAASSYSKNYYDVRAGVEDTNALALEFNAIAARNGRTLAAPTKYFITGVSMGGHITAAAIEDEAAATAINKVKYSGAVPMCGVVGDTELFSQFAAMQVTAQALAGVPAYPTDKFVDINALVTSTLFTTFPSVPTAQGQKYLSVVQNITGGPRPMFDLGIAFGGSFPSAYGTFIADPNTPYGSVTGILNKNVLDTTGYTYTITDDAAGSTALNASAQKISPAADANRLRTDGLRWVPKANGEFKIPVVSIHTLGDLFVPFSMQQVYQKRVAAKGNSAFLVQRAIRGVSHCDFTIAEQVTAFDDMLKWEGGGAKPVGDDVVTAATVAATTYGCAFTNNTLGQDDGNTTRQLRTAAAAQRPCP